MKNYFIIITCSIMVAIITTIILKYLGLESTAGIAGGVAGGISGALSSILLKNKSSFRLVCEAERIIIIH